MIRTLHINNDEVTPALLSVAVVDFLVGQLPFAATVIERDVAECMAENSDPRGFFGAVYPRIRNRQPCFELQIVDDEDGNGFLVITHQSV